MSAAEAPLAEAPLAEGAQWISRQLARYARLVDGRDSAAIARLLADAEVTFKNQGPISGAAMVEEFYSRAFAGSLMTTFHLPSPPAVEQAEPASLRYEAPYLRLVDPGALPRVDATGVYRGIVVHTGHGWRFQSFRVDTM
jgi:hypothetical protein